MPDIDTAVSTRVEQPSTDVARFMPQNIGELTRFADTIAKSNLFGQVSPQQALVLMMYGAELGLNPLASMREIYLIPGRNGRIQMLPSAALVSARIAQSDDCTKWETDVDAKHCTIRFQRKGRAAQTITVRIEDIPPRYFEPMRSGQPSQWSLIPEDMLYAWTVRRVARRHFADKLVAIQGEADEIDESRVIDVAAVHREIRQDGPFDQPHIPKGAEPGGPECQGRVWLQASSNGGAFLICDACGATFSPPQDVRDAIRGIPEHLTIAGTAEAATEPPSEDLPSPEQPVDAPESAVQSDSESATIDEAAVVPASAENAPLMAEPEPAVAPAVAAERQAEAEAKSIDWMDSWRRSARIAIAVYLDQVRALPGDVERKDAIKRLRAVGWDPDTMGSANTFVDGAQDETLTILLQDFHLSALPTSTPEAPEDAL